MISWKMIDLERTWSTVWHNVLLFHCLLGVYGDDWHIQAAKVLSGEERLQPCYHLWPALFLRLYREMLHSPHRLHLWQHSIGPAKALKAPLYWQTKWTGCSEERCTWMHPILLYCCIFDWVWEQSWMTWLMLNNELRRALSTFHSDSTG